MTKLLDMIQKFFGPRTVEAAIKNFNKTAENLRELERTSIDAQDECNERIQELQNQKVTHITAANKADKVATKIERLVSDEG